MKKDKMTPAEIEKFRSAPFRLLKSVMATCAVAGLGLVIGIKLPDAPIPLGLVFGVIIFFVDITVMKGEMSRTWTIYVAIGAIIVLLLSKVFFDSDSRFYFKFVAVSSSVISWSVLCFIAKPSFKNTSA